MRVEEGVDFLQINSRCLCLCAEAVACESRGSDIVGSGI